MVKTERLKTEINAKIEKDMSYEDHRKDKEKRSYKILKSLL
jgi:hypothetical protein